MAELAEAADSKSIPWFLTFSNVVVKLGFSFFQRCSACAGLTSIFQGFQPQSGIRCHLDKDLRLSRPGGESRRRHENPQGLNGL
jgi:hypothetical protein